MTVSQDTQQETPEKKAHKLWRSFYEHLLSIHDSWSTRLEDVVRVYIGTDNPIIQAAAERTILGYMDHHATKAILYRLATSSWARDIWSRACTALLKHPEVTTRELEGLLTMGHLNFLYREIAITILNRPDVSLDTLLIIRSFRCCTGLLEESHLTRIQELETREQAIKNLLVQTATGKGRHLVC